MRWSVLTKQSPWQVLQDLPKDATPWQQDSAIQKHFPPGAIHYNERPDTLGLPGQPGVKPFSAGDVVVMGKGAVTEDSVSYSTYKYHTIKTGVSASPSPYNMSRDTLMGGLVLFIAFVALLVYSKSGNLILRHAKQFFHPANALTTPVAETTTETRFLYVLPLMTIVVCALLFFFYVFPPQGGAEAVRWSKGELLLFSIVIFAVYFLLKGALMKFVNWVFFDSKKIEQFRRHQILLIGWEGLLLFPIVLVMAYTHFPLVYALYYVLGVIVFVKILSFYKGYVIFFRRFGAILQNFLYFCALELIPLFALYGVLAQSSMEMKIIF